MIKSSLLNYELPNSSINQEPYENPLDSKLLIAKNREIISFKQFPEYVESDSLFIFNKSIPIKENSITINSQIAGFRLLHQQLVYISLMN